MKEKKQDLEMASYPPHKAIPKGNNNEIKRLLRQMANQLKRMKQAIENLSIHMEEQESKSEDMETRLQDLTLKYDKLASHHGIHYNIISGFA